MDIGVGAVMFATGLSARKVREAFTNKKVPFLKELFSTIKGSIIIIIIGFMRFIIIKDLNYQEHLSEWGIHWNFFATISIVNICIVLISNIKHSLLIAISMMLGYEFCLTT